MTAERYAKIYAWFTARPRALRALRALTRALPLVTAAGYAGLLARLAWAWLRLRQGPAALAQQAGAQLVRAVAAPALAFAACTLLRRAINAPRPYETPGFVPLVEKRTKGQAFPSRHAASAAVIAAVWWPVQPAVGAAMTLTAALICATRVLAGAHRIRDVLAGAAFGAACGAAGLWLL